MAKHDKHKTDDDQKDGPVKDEQFVEAPRNDIEESPMDEHYEAAEASEERPAAVPQGQQQNSLKRVWHWALTHKKLCVPALAVVLLAVLAAVPFTRYLLAGTIVKQTFPVVVVDAESGKPVSSATIRLAGKESTTSGEGHAEIKVNVGKAKLEVTKKYYETSTHDVLVPIGKPDKAYEVKLKAKGRVVPIAVVNSISKKPAANIAIKASDGIEAKTDDDGKASLVVPADKKEVKVTLSGESFNNIETTVTVTTEETDANTLSITPSGKIYFLSNASGKIDLVKSNLDGTDRQTVLAGTGKEDKQDTVMDVSNDLKYIALRSSRDGGEYPKLFLVESSTDKVTVMDEGEATFELFGWSGDRFVYKVNREKYKPWDSKRESIKSYHAPSKKITTLFSTAAEGGQYGGYVSQYVSGIYIFGQEILYGKAWTWGGGYYGQQRIVGKEASLETVRADNSQAKTIKSYPSSDLYLQPGKFGEIYVQYYQDNKNKYDLYKDGKTTFLASYTDEEFWNREYFSYFVSPSGNKTMWKESRDGKNVFFIGDSKGENAKEIARAAKFYGSGWFTDDYVLISKEGNEMHIIPATGFKGELEKSLKITDYYAY